MSRGGVEPPGVPRHKVSGNTIYGIVMTPTPDLAPIVAVIFAVPVAMAVTSPVLEITAFALLDEVHTNVRPFNAGTETDTLSTSNAVADSCFVAPTTTLELSGVTTIRSIATSDTVTVSNPNLFSMIHEMTVVPAANPVITPAVETVATVESVVAHTKERWSEVNVPPVEFFNTDVIAIVRPICTALAVDNVTDATGTSETVTDTELVLPLAVAVTVVAPAVTAVINPVLDTVATAVLLDAHVVANAVNVLLLPSLTTATACNVCPT